MPIIAYHQDTLIYNIEFGGVLSLLFVLPLGMHFAIYSFDSIVIDEERKTIHIKIRKFDKIVDKGEYPIDNNLAVKIAKKKNAAAVSIRLFFSIRMKESFQRALWVMGGIWKCTQLFVMKVEKIKKTNPSIQVLG